jgi:flagellar basal-body rod protein FlgB
LRGDRPIQGAEHGTLLLLPRTGRQPQSEEFCPLNDVTMTALQSMLRGLSARQQAIADNMANLETPGYTAKQVQFEDSLRSALESGDGSVAPVTVASTDPALPNGNNVSLEKETLSMQDTSLRYEMAIQAMTAKFQLLRTSISGNGG